MCTIKKLLEFQVTIQRFLRDLVVYHVCVLRIKTEFERVLKLTFLLRLDHRYSTIDLSDILAFTWAGPLVSLIEWFSNRAIISQLGSTLLLTSSKGNIILSVFYVSSPQLFNIHYKSAHFVPLFLGGIATKYNWLHDSFDVSNCYSWTRSGTRFVCLLLYLNLGLVTDAWKSGFYLIACAVQHNKHHQRRDTSRIRHCSHTRPTSPTSTANKSHLCFACCASSSSLCLPAFWWSQSWHCTGRFGLGNRNRSNHCPTWTSDCDKQLSLFGSCGNDN